MSPLKVCLNFSYLSRAFSAHVDDSQCFNIQNDLPPLTFISAVVFGLNGNWFGVNDLSAPITICSHGFLGICPHFLGV